MATIAASLGITGSPVSAATAAMISTYLLGGAGIELKDIMIVCIPTSLIAILVADFVQNRIGKELHVDEIYQERISYWQWPSYRQVYWRKARMMVLAVTIRKSQAARLMFAFTPFIFAMIVQDPLSTKRSLVNSVRSFTMLLKLSSAISDTLKSASFSFSLSFPFMVKYAA